MIHTQSYQFLHIVPHSPSSRWARVKLFSILILFFVCASESRKKKNTKKIVDWRTQPWHLHLLRTILDSYCRIWTHTVRNFFFLIHKHNEDFFGRRSIKKFIFTNTNDFCLLLEFIFRWSNLAIAEIDYFKLVYWLSQVFLRSRSFVAFGEYNLFMSDSSGILRWWRIFFNGFWWLKLEFLRIYGKIWIFWGYVVVFDILSL
jgi:hypothetical protein